MRNRVFIDRDWVDDENALCKQIAIPRRVKHQGNCGRDCRFFQYLPNVLPSSPWKPAPFAPGPSCAIATEVAGPEEFIVRKLRRHSHLPNLDASSRPVDRASPCQSQGAFRRKP